MRQIKNLTGKRFGFLTVSHMMKRVPKFRTQWYCRCDCGGNIIKDGNSLTKMYMHSCGCNKMHNREHLLIAKKFGYKTEKEMLEDWLGQGRSFYEIAGITGFAHSTHRYRAINLGLQSLFRKVGGNNYGPFRDKIWADRAESIGFKDEAAMFGTKDIKLVFSLLSEHIKRTENRFFEQKELYYRWYTKGGDRGSNWNPRHGHKAF